MLLSGSPITLGLRPSFSTITDYVTDEYYFHINLFSLAPSSFTERWDFVWSSNFTLHQLAGRPYNTQQVEND